MKQAVIAIIKWQYWLFNHGDVDETIKAVFPDLAQHFIDKFEFYCNHFGNTAAAWIHWFMDLSADRQEKFAAWVMENYHGVDNRFMNQNRKSAPLYPHQEY